MKCLWTLSYQILQNGNCSDNFKLSRDLRKCCPFSPYLFRFCIERLSQMVNFVVGIGNWFVCLGRGSPLSYLLRR
ncbi:hypothetical protein LINPERPRIM_LOCUS21251 [Linum perenne]